MEHAAAYHHESIRLHAEDHEARSSIATAVDHVLASHPEQPYLSVTLDGEQMPAETVAALVTGLRRVRELGGAIEVLPASSAIRDALSVTGLDRIFAFPLRPEAAERPRRRRPFLRFAAGALAGAIALIGTPAFAAADRPTDPAAIIARVEQRNPSLSSYQGRMHVDLRMTSFPYIRQHLDGTTYFKRPANYEVVFDKVPALAKGFDKMFTDAGDPANWEKRFVITYEGEHEYNWRKDLQLRLVQRVRGMIDHETVLIDPNAWTVDSIRYDYYNGGHITMTQTFRDVGGYSMLAEQDADIAIPYAKAVAHGTYGDYKTNVAIDDTVFQKAPKQ